MIETLESRRLLSALPISERPVETEPRTIRVVTLDEFLQLENWNDDEIVVEWYSKPSGPSNEGGGGGDSGEDDDWDYELEEEMSGEDGEGWLDDVCDGPLDDDEALDEEDWTAVEESDVLEAPIVFAVNEDGSTILVEDDTGIADDLLGAGEDDVLA